MKTIGIITNDQRQIFQHNIIAGVRDYLTEGYEVLVDSIAEDPRNRRDVSPDMDHVDGLLVISNVLSYEELKSIHERGIPLSLVSHREAGLDIPAVIQSNRDGMSKLVDYIVQEKGRRQIVFIQGDLNQYDGKDRDDLYQQGLMRHDLIMPDDYSLEGNFDAVVATGSMLEFLDSGKPFDAVIASDYLMGCAVLDLMNLFEVNIPQDVSVVAFGDGVEAREMGLTVVGVDVMEIGRRAARQLIGQMDGMAINGVTWLHTELNVRESS